jgi:hypothetical protein
MAVNNDSLARPILPVDARDKQTLETTASASPVIEQNHHHQSVLEIHSAYLRGIHAATPSSSSKRILQTPTSTTSVPPLPTTDDQSNKNVDSPHMLPEDYYSYIVLGPHNIGGQKFSSLNRHIAKRIAIHNDEYSPCNAKSPALCINDEQ